MLMYEGLWYCSIRNMASNLNSIVVVLVVVAAAAAAFVLDVVAFVGHLCYARACEFT